MKYIILGHENPDVDSVISGYLLEKVMKLKGYDCSFLIPDRVIAQETVDICKRYKIDVNQFRGELDDKNASYILVDHNVREVPGKIVGIIDHHPREDKPDVAYYKNEKASSTACMIALDSLDCLNKKDIELACLATFIDTVSFHSSKTRKSDVSWVNEMCTKYEFDYDQMYREGLCLTNLSSTEDVMFNGIKKYDFDGFKIHCSYIQVDSIGKNEGVIDEILENLNQYFATNEIDMYVFIVYDMSEFYTRVFKITNEKVDVDEYFLYASRGNTIIPDIVKKHNAGKAL